MRFSNINMFRLDYIYIYFLCIAIYTIQMRDSLVRQQIGARLLAERIRLGLTQQSLADAIGSSRLSVVQYESGRSSPAAETLAALAAVGFDIRFVLSGERASSAGVNRERFRLAYEEVLRQAKVRRERLSAYSTLDLAWRIYDALDQIPRASGQR